MTRVAAVRLVLEQETPYRVDVRLVRAILSVLPIPRRRYRRAQARLVAALVALPGSLHGGGL